MKQQNDTKKVIADAFQELTTKKAIDKISITDIMKQADFRRQTFYDYFDDKYDLVTWIFYYDLFEKVQPIITWENWENLLMHLLIYLEQNKAYYKKIFLNKKLDSFKEYFIYSIKKMTKQVIDDYFKKQSLSSEKEEIIHTAISFYSYGLSESLYHWVLENCNPSGQHYQKMLVQLVKYRTNIN
ncbi:dihydroxyacetone kinase transcriptional activator DhaS [Alkalibacterium kapii]|uniref:Dihydroxyacetone kinase transcriptional activator DhaS n=1 Tax=Alkalibacterium kapii TaxID=426704 RepID=A0A511ARI7_9LACT|nr:dihydroxyacetone kinase transcriptional activator DhaS [Alkalibacterium kapii]GEK90820.1 dihydroxyacetone kinase transcriptional activator DhaS [Alkalibacterium kapii]